jgi:hypothetical protein
MLRCFGLLLLFSFFCSCSPRPEKAPGDAAGPFPGAPLALLQAGENPLWFELAEDGPRRIDFPGNAALSPFTPWALARHIRFVLPLEDELVMGVNGDGFLRFVPGEVPVQTFENGAAHSRGILLYRAADPGRWGQYTLAALFPFGGGPAALLYRDDFFAESSLPPPEPRAFVLNPEFPEPQPLEIPAFGGFPQAAGWNLDALHAGPDGYWYYRAVRKNAVPPEIEYWRTRSLGLKGEAVSVAAFQNAAFPEPLSAAPAPLRSALEAAFALLPGGGSAAVVSPAFPGSRWFSGGGAAEAAGEAGTETAGFYREPGAGRPGIALVVLPGGQGGFAVEGVGPAVDAAAGVTADAAEADAAVIPTRTRDLSLPTLPPGFAYTAAALCGDVLVAAWEEQEGYGIGAAGFMVIAVPFI